MRYEWSAKLRLTYKQAELIQSRERRVGVDCNIRSIPVPTRMSSFLLIIVWCRPAMTTETADVFRKHDNVFLKCTTARIITNYDNTLLQFAISTLLQITTRAITIYDRYYNSRQLLLQFTTGIKIHDSTTSPLTRNKG